MNEPSSTLKRARSKLAEALSLLQGQGAPGDLRRAAEPVARSMGLLHEMERSPEAMSKAKAALAMSAVRDALSALQANASSHSAKEQAVTRVAAALGMVHSLTQLAAANPHNGPNRPRAAIGAQTLSLLGSPQTPITASLAALKPRANVAPKNATQGNAQPFSAEAALGAHSSSNFYQGLSGHDVIEAGGLFVATYRIPAIGEPVALRVHLPGGYEFHARGIVAWTRETTATLSEGLDAPPGFGARFTEITPEARALVMRYVGQREPLYHDDI